MADKIHWIYWMQYWKRIFKISRKAETLKSFATDTTRRSDQQSRNYSAVQVKPAPSSSTWIGEYRHNQWYDQNSWEKARTVQINRTNIQWKDGLPQTLKQCFCIV